jgi:hypothetical protein
MDDEILRFVNVREAQSRSEAQAGADRIDLYDGGRFRTDFGDALLLAANSGDAGTVRGHADTYVYELGLPADLDALDLSLGRFDRRISASGLRPSLEEVVALVAGILDGTPQEVVDRFAFGQTWRRLADSILAVSYATVGRAAARKPAHLVRGLRLCALLARLASADADAALDLPARTLRALVSIPVTDEAVRSLGADLALGLHPLYRLLSPGGDHWYTTSPAERHLARTTFKNVDEGVACFVLTEQHPDTAPLFRLFHAGRGRHFYTTSADERDHAVSTGFADEGIACWVETEPSPGTTPLHRLYAPSTHDHLYTTSTTESAAAIEEYGYVPEGTEGRVHLLPLSGGAARPAGVADLLLVRQQLRRYERGEIAHVENALQGEVRKRVHQRTSTTETALFEETETTTENEKDLSTTERFELKREASRTVEEDMSVQAGLTVTASYGAVTATATGDFSFERSVEEATRTATTYARDVVDRSKSRLQERELERRTRRTAQTVDETNEHGLTNTGADAEHVVGVYRWIDKLYDAQVVDYGCRLMLEFTVPEPAAYHRQLEARAATRTTSMTKPTKPRLPDKADDLRPEDVTWPGIQKLAADYGVTDLAPPPAGTVIVGTSLEVPFTDKDYKEVAPAGFNRMLPAWGATKVSADLKVPKGYGASSITWSGSSRAYVRKDPFQGKSYTIVEDLTSVSIGSVTTDGLSGSTADVAGFVEFVPVAMVTSAAAAVVTFKLECSRTTESYEEWQSETYDVIMLAYQDALARYEDEVSRLGVQEGIQVSGLPEADNRRIESLELRRAVLSILTGQQFEHSSALDAPLADGSHLPALVLDHAAALGDVVTYFEQAFEWQNMTYVFYPYFWGRRGQWPDMLARTSTDALFTRFLQAGYARVQVPVRPKFDSAVLYYLSTNKIWQQPEDAPLPAPYLPIVEEVRNHAGDDFALGPGRVFLTRGSTTVTGAGTTFSPADVDRQIRAAGRVHRIVKVESPSRITLHREAAEDAREQPYALGPKLIGPTWEVRLPTTLVMIDRPDVVLPSWPE